MSYQTKPQRTNLSKHKLGCVMPSVHWLILMLV